MQTVRIFNIQHFSVHDGPGVRTVVFFKGCNLHCRWCHNPESIRGEKEILLYPDRCIGCGACVQQCPAGAHSFPEGKHRVDRKRCIRCFRCCEECYADALVCVGEETDTETVMDEIRRNKGYFAHSGGGVTFSGGECMLQTKPLTQLLECCRREGIHTAVDTAGNVPYKDFERILPYTDLFLYDMKAFHEQVHRELTGVSNERIKDNLLRLSRTGTDIRIRIPVIEELNAAELPFMKDFLWENGIRDIELLAYHRMGVGKGDLLLEPVRQESFRELDARKMEEYRNRYQI